MTNKKAEQLSFGYIKAEGINNKCEREVRRKIKDEGLKIVFEKDVVIKYGDLRKHQPILFDLKNDINDIWKIQGAARLIGSTVRCFIVSGEDAINKLHKIKLEIRKKYALPCEFDRENQKSYPNYMHASDDKEQVEQDIRILLPEMLQYCIEVNGEHITTKTIW